MQTIILLGWPCAAEDSRSRISHDWLGNRILRLNAEVVAEMHGEESEDREEFESYLLPGGACEQYLGELRKLAETVVDGYSPAQLVAQTALNTLPKDSQDQVKTAIHKAYLNARINGGNTIEDLQVALRAAVHAFEAALADFRNAWSSGDVPAQAIRHRFEDVLRQASNLREALSQLPRGIILP